MTALETISACENVCQDFSWIGPVTEWLRNLAIIVGVWVAYTQLNAWRREHLSKRKAEVAEQLLSVALNVKLAIQSVRTAMENLPADVENPLDEIIKIKWERLYSYKDDFDRLREHQVLHEALVGNTDVKEAVDELFDVRQEVFAALATLTGWHLGDNPRPEHFEIHENLKQKIYSMGPRYDDLSPRVNAAIETLRGNLLPEIRMENL